VDEELDILDFATTVELWSWLEEHHESHPGLWVRLQEIRKPDTVGHLPRAPGGRDRLRVG